eukprot:gene7664-10427_t
MNIVKTHTHNSYSLLHAKQSKSDFPDANSSSSLRSILLSSMIGFSLMNSLPLPSFANVGGPLEKAISSLEESKTRGETVQTMADLYEAAGEKTLLARTKFKYRIIEAINDKRVQLSSEWDQALGYESKELKRRVDPYRTVDLGGYLKVAPYYGGALYLAALFVQQALPELFIFAYPLAAVAFTAPIAFIVLAT